MISLTDESRKRAFAFLRTGARPLERRLARARFEGWSYAPVLDALEGFRNADGGFGSAIEPDVRTPSSSALGTCLALRVLREAGCGFDDEMVRGAIDFLVETCDRASMTWRVVPPDANEHPHAPWWHDVKGSLAKTFDGFRIIPRALAVSHLHAFSKLVPPGFLAEVTEAAVDAIERAPVLGSGGGSDLEYTIELAETPDLPPDLRGRLGRRIRSAIPDVVERDPIRWGTYCITPLRIAPRPDAFGADLIRDELEAHLDFTIGHQAEDGAWDPTWTWGDSYPEIWPIAREEWRGILTLETLTALRAFGRA
jgi:hypothetical protein